jgi:hypothetical protein
MGGHRTHGTHERQSRLSWFGFLVGEPSNKPLKLTIGRGRPLAA